MYNITLYIDGKESKTFEWPVIPRVGEHVEPDGSGTYKVLKIVHILRRKEEKHVCLVAAKEEVF